MLSHWELHPFSNDELLFPPLLYEALRTFWHRTTLLSMENSVTGANPVNRNYYGMSLVAELFGALAEGYPSEFFDGFRYLVSCLLYFGNGVETDFISPFLEISLF